MVLPYAPGNPNGTTSVRNASRWMVGWLDGWMVGWLDLTDVVLCATLAVQSGTYRILVRSRR